MLAFTDQTGRTIQLADTPRRIVSLVPSQTELLADLGLEDEVVGITKFCVHPENWYRNKIRVGGTKQLKPGIIHQLKPDLVIANKEENVKEQIEELAKQYPVWISDISNLEDALQMIFQLSTITKKGDQGSAIIHEIKKAFLALSSQKKKQKAAYLIWQKPYMAAGGDTFINDMMDRAGFENVFQQKERYPEVTLQEIIKAGTEILLLSSEPFPFQQKHADQLKDQLPGIKIILTDGELFSWYGSRLLKAPGYFKKLQTEIAELST